MLKDIYSPLEIDEQWDQRAPMADGDMGSMDSMGRMAHMAPEANAATAVMEAPSVAPVMPEGTPTDADQSTSIGHFGGEATATMSDTTESVDPSPMVTTDEKLDTPSTESTETTPSDDEAVSKLGESETDTTEAPEESGLKLEGDSEPTVDTSDTPHMIMPTETFTPDQPRDQLVTPKSTEEDTQKDDIESDDKAESEDTDTSGIVMAEHHDGAHKAPDEDEAAPVIPEEPKAPEISDEEHNVSGQKLEAMSEVLQNLDTEVEKLLEELGAEDTRLADMLTEKNDTIKSAQDDVGIIEAQRATIADKVATLEKLKDK
ncbi:hypothetical protein H0W80_00630 [Candidatus Saccharibacteria bacterium]|nr:hypothetical protein [Candidatus Saccharibacteria bacterium]